MKNLLKLDKSIVLTLFIFISCSSLGMQSGLQNEPDLSRSFVDAVANRNGKMITQLILSGRAAIEARVFDGKTALIFAARHGDTEIVRLLLELGAKVNATDDEGETALMVAAMWGRTDIVELLLEYGANPNFTNRDGQTALDLATENEYTDVVDLLGEK